MARQTRRPMVAGNWKMNGLKTSRREITSLARKLKLKSFAPDCDVLVCPPATLLSLFKETAKGSRIKFGGQDCHWGVSGAHTGDISAAMLKDAGAAAIIVGHSERRSDYGETSAMVKAKAVAAHDVGLNAIVCIGETEAERRAGNTLRIVGAQLKASLPKGASAANSIIAYEPVWAIGTGLTPTLDDIAEVHAYIRRRLQALLGEQQAAKTRVLYGGSVKPDNAAELMAVDNVDGALVGGASLKSDDFLGIISAYL